MNSSGKKCFFSKFMLFFRDKQVNNSVLMMVNKIFEYFSGFLLWILIARLFSEDVVGTGTIIISLLNLVSQIGRLGFDVSAYKFIPTEKKNFNNIFSFMAFASVAVSFFSSIIIVIVSYFIYDMLFSSLIFLILFVIFSVFWSLYFIFDSVLFSLYYTKFVLLKTFVFNILRVTFIIVFYFIQPNNVILLIWGLSETIATIVGFILIKRKVTTYKFNLKSVFSNIYNLKKFIKFSLDSYIADFLFRSINFITPFIIGITLSVSSAAYFYMSWQMTMILYVVPQAISVSLLVYITEQKKVSKRRIIDSLNISLIFSFFSIIFVIFLGKHILLVFGESYSIFGYPLLVVFSFSTFAYSYISIEFSRLRNNLQTRIILFFTLILTIVYFAFIFFFNHYGYKLLTFALAWFSSVSITALIMLLLKIIFEIKEIYKKETIEQISKKLY